MIKGIYFAARSINSHSRNLERIANNLANLNTIGYKREGMFVEILNQYGPSQFVTPVDYRQGSLHQTGNPLNLAIVGNGYFVLQNNDSYEFTRNGSFIISEDGFLSDHSGKRVLGKNGEINLLEFTINEEQPLLINEQGEIKIGNILIDTLLIAKNNERMNNRSNLNLVYNEVSNFEIDFADDNYKILQGYLEESNVNPIEEMQNMIRVSKDYETSYKVVQSLDDSIQKANEIGKV